MAGGGGHIFSSLAVSSKSPVPASPHSYSPENTIGSLGGEDHWVVFRIFHRVWPGSWRVFVERVFIDSGSSLQS